MTRYHHPTNRLKKFTRRYVAKHPHLFRLAVRYYTIRHGMWRHLTARWRHLPDFLIIGGAKCGTSSLYDFIVRHPEIEAAHSKELVYWPDPIKGGLDWYRANFPPTRRSCLTGEADPTYFALPGVPAQMKAALPDVKLIVILRDPVERAYSHYNFYRTRNRLESCNTFEAALELEEPRGLAAERVRRIISSMYGGGNGQVDDAPPLPTRVNMYDLLPWATRIFHQYTTYGHYADHLEKWFEYYPRRQFLILSTTDMKHDRQAVLNRVYDFLGVSSFMLDDAVPNLYVGRYELPINEQTRQRLAKHFAPYNERLYRLVGRDFGWPR